MYALRGLAICFSTFFLVYVAISAAVVLAWPRIIVHGQKWSPRICSDILFSLRISPLALAVLATLLFAGPSFVMFEPHAAKESIGPWLPILGLGGLAVIAAGVWNAASALRRISSAASQWVSGASRLSHPAGFSGQITLLRTTAVAPPLSAAGVFRARVWLSSKAEQVLSESELHSALRHEFVHVRRRDNLRKLFLRFVTFPGMAKLEAAWLEATEMAADDGAVSNALEALDLVGGDKTFAFHSAYLAVRACYFARQQSGGIAQCPCGAIAGLVGTPGDSFARALAKIRALGGCRVSLRSLSPTAIFSSAFTPLPSCWCGKLLHMPSGHKGSIHLFRFSGIDVFLHWSWFLVAVWEINRQKGMYSSILWNVLSIWRFS